MGAVKSTGVTGTAQRGSAVAGTVVDFNPAGGGGGGNFYLQEDWTTGQTGNLSTQATPIVSDGDWVGAGSNGPALTNFLFYTPPTVGHSVLRYSHGSKFGVGMVLAPALGYDEYVHTVVFISSWIQGWNGSNRDWGIAFNSNAAGTEYYSVRVNAIGLKLYRNGTQLGSTTAISPWSHATQDYTISATVSGGDIDILFTNVTLGQTKTISVTDSTYMDATHNYMGVYGSSQSFGYSTEWGGHWPATVETVPL